MSLQKLQIAIDNNFSEVDRKSNKALYDFVKGYIEEKTAEYKSNRDQGLITFGKYKGSKVEELVKLAKGRDYLGWVHRQTWFTSDKFPDLHAQIEEAIPSLKKKT